MAILALEASTSSAKAMLFDRTHDKILKVVSRPYPRELCDVKSMDGDGVVGEVLKLGRELADGRRDIDLIVLSSIWYHSGGLFGSDMEPQSRLKTWADTSCLETVEGFRKDPALYQRIYELTGNPPHSIYALYIWLGLCQNLGLSPNEVGAFMALPDYLFYRFTKKRMVSRMTASASGLMNIRKLEWDDFLLDRCGIAPHQLSSLVECEHTEPLCREAAESLGLREGLPVLVTGADGGCNQIAVGGLLPGVMSMSVGTSGAIRHSATGPQISNGPLKNWCYYGAERRWINGAATNGACSCLDWFANHICGGIRLEELNREFSALPTPPVDAPIFLPFQFGERCPGWNDNRKGGWQELTASTDRRALYYSVLEGVLFNLYQCYLLLCPSGSPPERIRLSGGIVRAEAWIQMAADIFGMPMELTDVQHASILGAVRIGQKCLGDISSLSDISCEPARTVLSKAPDRYAERFERYLAWYERCK